MKILEGLKIEAIAVEVPDGYCEIKLTRTSIAEGSKPILVYHDMEDDEEPPRYIEIPEGYSVLGRADEISYTEYGFPTSRLIFKLLDLPKGGQCVASIGHTNNRYIQLWQSYMEVNNLTNELILIKQ